MYGTWLAKSKLIYNEVENDTRLKHTSTAECSLRQLRSGGRGKMMQKQEAKIFKGIIKDKKIKDVV